MLLGESFFSFLLLTFGVVVVGAGFVRYPGVGGEGGLFVLFCVLRKRGREDR